MVDNDSILTLFDIHIPALEDAPYLMNLDALLLLRIFGTPKIPTQDRKALTNSNVEVFFAGYRPNFEN